jgi:hypothetical protein
MNRASAVIAAATVFLACTASAETSRGEACRSIGDPAARLACYDRAMGAGASANSPVSAVTREDKAPEAAAPPLATRSKQSLQEVGDRRQDQATPAKAGRIAVVSPIRHGYYRLELDDGTAYETTVTGTPPPAGASVQIRRTFLGTTFFDIKGWSPVSVRLARPR